MWDTIKISDIHYRNREGIRIQGQWYISDIQQDHRIRLHQIKVSNNHIGTSSTQKVKKKEKVIKENFHFILSGNGIRI